MTLSQPQSSKKEHMRVSNLQTLGRRRREGAGTGSRRGSFHHGYGITVFRGRSQIFSTLLRVLPRSPLVCRCAFHEVIVHAVGGDDS